jgi:hypothetical protein
VADVTLFNRMLADLRLRGLDEGSILQARKHWLLLPMERNPYPCPICYANGRTGVLTPLSELDGLERLRCRDCDSTIQLSPAGDSTGVK